MGIDRQRPKSGARMIAGEERGVRADRPARTLAPGKSHPVIVETKRVRVLRRPDAAKPADRDVVTCIAAASPALPRIAPRSPLPPCPIREVLSPHERHARLLCAAEEQRMATMAEARRRCHTDHQPVVTAKREGAPKGLHGGVTPPTTPAPEPGVLHAVAASQPVQRPFAASKTATSIAGPETTRAADHRFPDRGPRFTKRDILWRISGVALVAAAAGSSLIHRHVLSLEANHAASALEMGLGLTSFVLASLGVLLMIHGAGLRDKWVLERSTHALRPEQTAGHRAGHPGDFEHLDPAASGSGREAIAAMLVQRTHAPSHRSRQA